MMNCGVYKLEFPDGRFYIGSSKNVTNRLRGHRGALTRKVHKNYRVQRAFDKYQTLTGKLLLVCRENDLIFYEQLGMNRLNPTLNFALIAGREAAGRIVSAETRAKLVKAHKDRPRPGPMAGRKHSLETREKLSKSHLGYKPSEETRERLRVSNTGKRHTEEAKERMSIIAKGRKHTEETKIKIGHIGLGRHHSEKTKALISANLKGNKYAVGLKPSPETLAKRSASLKLAWARRPKEDRERLSSMMLGNKRAARKKNNVFL